MVGPTNDTQNLSQVQVLLGTIKVHSNLISQSTEAEQQHKGGTINYGDT